MERPAARVAAQTSVQISVWSGAAVIAVAMALRPAIPGTSPWFVLWTALGATVFTFLASHRLLSHEQKARSPEHP